MEATSAILKFIDELSTISEKCRVKVNAPSLTRNATYFIKGEHNGLFYSLIIIDSKIDMPELIVRDYTRCKTKIMEIWHG